MAEKHYHNDYKKLMGLDESRTASQKLLDRAIGKRESTLTVTKVQNDQPKKIVKKEVQEDRQINPEDAIDKVLRSYSMRNNLIKMQKCLQIFTKILQSEQFVQTLKAQKFIQIVETMLNNKTFLHGSLGELINYAKFQIKVLTILVTLMDEKFNQAQGNLKQKINLQVQVLNLITDDNFSFSKFLSSLKATIFDVFEKQSQQHSLEVKIQPQQDKNKLYDISLPEFVEEYILTKLLTLPNLHLEWARSGITNLLKQFIGNHKDKLKKPKQFLIQYNKFMQNKKSSTETTTHDIMGKKSIAGGAYTVLETQDATNTWCKRQ